MNKMLMMMAACFCTIGMMAQGNPQVKTTDGTLEGIERSGVKVFLGVPFAAPPVGDLRWKAPQPVVAWEGVRSAKDFGPNPMQENIFGDMNFGTKENSEDCLYLNIWTPAHTMKEKLPVLIYFNGGGLMAGSGSEPRYAGESMARKGIIAITANYREGIFGFFSHPQLSKETAYKGSGNYGFMDQVAAIQWVKTHIADFGGDPERITIAGESAGSMSVSALMASPLCQGLIAQAIGSSGSVMGFNAVATLKEAETTGVEIAKALGCKTIKQLRAMPAEELMKRANVRNVPKYCIDGYFFTEQPTQTYADGKQLHIPLLIGGNNQEMSPQAILAGQPASVEVLKEAARQKFGDATDQLFRLYGIYTANDVTGQPGTDLASDLFLDYSTWKWGHMHQLTSGQPVYRYRYCHPRPAMAVKGKVAGLAGGILDAKDGEPAVSQDKGAVHSADIEYAMGTLPTNRVYDWQPDDYMISDVFSNYYANFVKTGNPNGLGLVNWPAVNGKTVPPVLQIDVHTFVKTDEAMQQRYLLMDKLFWK